MSSQKIIVVAGANGALGKLLCYALLARAQIEGQSVLVRGLVRKGGAQAPTVSTDGLPPTNTRQRLIMDGPG